MTINCNVCERKWIINVMWVSNGMGGQMLDKEVKEGLSL